MRRTEYLITEIRNSTDNVDASAIKDAEIIGYLNYGQRLIQNIIFKANTKSDLLLFEEIYEPVPSGQYTLPAKAFATNSILIVETKTGIDTVNDGYRPVDRIDPSEASIRFGYYTLNGTLYLSGMNTNYSILSLRVRAFKRLPRMDKRWGKITTVNPGVSIVLDPATYDSAINTVDDYITVIDKLGAQVRPSIFVDTFSSNTLLTSDALTGVTTDHFVCIGSDSVGASELPEECETYLLDYVRQRLYTRNNYADGNKQMGFTEKQEADIASLFSNNQKDTLFPPITDYEMLEW